MKKIMKDEYLKIGIILLLFIIGIGCSLYGLGTPTPIPSSAGKEVFSAERAMEHIEVIAQKPHPSGTVENERVRNYIVNQLEILGLSPQIQEAFVTNRRYNGKLSNIIAVLKGDNNSNSNKIAIVSHYDSVPEGPGASDDGVAVAAMLESLRALNQIPKLNNDIIFLFTDGEENGLLGADVFMKEHPLAKNIALVLNFEARGTAGASLMFETSDSNGTLIREFAKAAPYPAANSLSYEIYKRMPNDTDLTIFKNAGIPGMNFAFIFEGMNYHTKFDNMENVKLGTVQHHGSYALSLLKHFGNLDFQNTDLKTENRVYFDIMGQFLIHYPGSWVIPLLFIVIALSIIYIYINNKNNKLSMKSISISLFYIVSTMIVIILVNSVIKLIVNSLLSRVYSIYNIYEPYQLILKYLYYSNIFLTMFVTVTMVIIIASYLIFKKYIFSKTNTLNLFSKPALQTITLMLWSLLGGLLSITVPGASYLFVVPLLLSLVLYFSTYLINKYTSLGDIDSQFVSSSTLMFSGFFLIFPIIHLVNQAMGIDIIVFAMVLIMLPLLPVLPVISDSIYQENAVEKQTIAE